MPVDEHAVFEVPAHGLGEHGFFKIAAFTDQIVDVVPVRHPGDVLLDDRTIVEDRRRIVRGRPDQFHAARRRLMIGLAAGKRGQKRVVDVDDRRSAFFQKVRREHLHVACEHHQIDPQFAQPRQLTGLGGGLVGGRHRDEMKRQTIGRSRRREIGMIGNHGDKVARKVTGPVPQHEIVETVIKL